MSKGQWISRRAGAEGVEENLFEVSKDDLLVDDVCRVLKKRVEESSSWESVSTEKETSIERARSLKRDAWRPRHCLLEEMATLG